MSATLHDPPRPLDARLARVEPVIRRALAKDPASRFGSAVEMAEALREAASPPARAAAPPAPAAPDAAEIREVFAGRAAELGRLEGRLAAALSGAGSIWKAARVLGCALERLGRGPEARRAFETAARAVHAIAAGTRDDELRDGFLASPEVREVLDHAGGTSSAD